MSWRLGARYESLMTARRCRARVAALVLGVSLVPAPRAGWGGPPVVPAALRDVNGANVDVAALAATHRLVFVTLKASWCPLCRAQLKRLGKLVARVRACGATLVVLGPPPSAALAAIARESGLPYPFVADAGVAKSVGFLTTPDELVPGFFVVNEARAIVWEHRGRAKGAFGDREVLEYLGCPVPRGPDILARFH